MASVVTNLGKAIVANRIKGVGTEPLNVAWGTGSGTAAVTDTTLFTAAPEARTAGTSSQQTSVSPAITGDTYRVVGSITASATRAITEVGLFTDITAGSLFMHADFSVINLAAGDSISFTINTTIG